MLYLLDPYSSSYSQTGEIHKYSNLLPNTRGLYYILLRMNQSRPVSVDNWSILDSNQTNSPWGMATLAMRTSVHHHPIGSRSSPRPPKTTKDTFHNNNKFYRPKKRQSDDIDNNNNNNNNGNNSNTVSRPHFVFYIFLASVDVSFCSFNIFYTIA